MMMANKTYFIMIHYWKKSKFYTKINVIFTLIVFNVFTYKNHRTLIALPIKRTPNNVIHFRIPSGFPRYEGQIWSSVLYSCLIRATNPFSMNLLMKYVNAKVSDEFLGITNPICLIPYFLGKAITSQLL